MKKCKECGALQKDDRHTCIECGGRLGQKIPPEQEAAIQQRQRKQTERLYRSSTELNPFFITTGRKVLGILSAMAIFGEGIWLIVGDIKLEETAPTVVLSLFCFIFAVVFAFFSKILWNLEKIKIIMQSDFEGELQPSAWFVFLTRIGLWLFFGCGVFSLVAALLSVEII